MGVIGYKRILNLIFFLQNALEEIKQIIWKTSYIYIYIYIARKTMDKFDNKASFPQAFLINETSFTDKFQIVEGFHNYFSKIGSQTNHNVPQSNTHFTEYMPT